MRALIVGPYSPDGQYSIPAFVAALKTGLTKQDVLVDTISPSTTRAGRVLRPILGRRTGFFDKFVAFPNRLKKVAKHYDIVHIAEHGYSLYAKALPNVPTLVTCHDLIVAKAARGEIPDWPLSGPAIHYQNSILKSLRLANHVAAVSKSTLQDVVRLSGVSHSKTTLIYNGFYRPLLKMNEETIRRHLTEMGLKGSNPFLLHVGGNQPNKNKKGVFQIYSDLLSISSNIDLDLVLAGSIPDQKLLKEIDNSPLRDKIHIVDRPSDQQVIALYFSAKALLFPSLYEGFGLPIIEAQACGCPVITTNVAPMTEVGGKAAIYIDPSNSDEAAKMISQELPELGALVAEGIKNVERFTSEAMCRAYANLYQEIVR